MAVRLTLNDLGTAAASLPKPCRFRAVPAPTTGCPWLPLGGAVQPLAPHFASLLHHHRPFANLCLTLSTAPPGPRHYVTPPARQSSPSLAPHFSSMMTPCPTPTAVRSTINSTGLCPKHHLALIHSRQSFLFLLPHAPPAPTCHHPFMSRSVPQAPPGPHLFKTILSLSLAAHAPCPNLSSTLHVKVCAPSCWAL